MYRRTPQIREYNVVAMAMRAVNLHGAPSTAGAHIWLIVWEQLYNSFCGSWQKKWPGWCGKRFCKFWWHWRDQHCTRSCFYNSSLFPLFNIQTQWQIHKHRTRWQRRTCVNCTGTCHSSEKKKKGCRERHDQLIRTLREDVANSHFENAVYHDLATGKHYTLFLLCPYTVCWHWMLDKTGRRRTRLGLVDRV